MSTPTNEFAGQELERKTLADMQAEVRAVNEANGWFDPEHPRSVVEGHMLLITEVAEATEAYRRWGLEDATGRDCVTDGDGVHLHEGRDCKPEGVGSEYADILVRLLDQCERDGIDLGWEYERKIAFNKTRGYRHGGRAL